MEKIWLQLQMILAKLDCFTIQQFIQKQIRIHIKVIQVTWQMLHSQQMMPISFLLVVTMQQFYNGTFQKKKIDLNRGLLMVKNTLYQLVNVQ